MKLENEVVISEIVFGMIHGRPSQGFQKLLKDSQKSLAYQFRLLVTGIITVLSAR
jgi:hypothetical protein